MIFQDFFKAKYQDLLDASPELQELEGEGSKSGSVAPSATTGTPQPSATRIKLNVNSNRETNGTASTAAQSDEE